MGRLGNDADELIVVDDAVAVLGRSVLIIWSTSAEEKCRLRQPPSRTQTEGAGSGGIEGLEDSLEGGLAGGSPAEAEDVEESGVEVELRQ